MHSWSDKNLFSPLIGGNSSDSWAGGQGMVKKKKKKRIKSALQYTVVSFLPKVRKEPMYDAAAFQPLPSPADYR